MNPDDRVLVSVINRKRDLDTLLTYHWYRIPQECFPDGIFVEYLAFFLSGSASKKFGASGIYYYALRTGIELLTRRDLLPDETTEKAYRLADKRYYKVQFRQIETRHPPITNPTRSVVSFINTTGERFLTATIIPDLYASSTAG